MSAFAGVEIGELKQARDDGEQAWSLCENGNCAHSLTHVHLEAGSLDEGAAFINQVTPPSMNSHNSLAPSRYSG